MDNISTSLHSKVHHWIDAATDRAERVFDALQRHRDATREPVRLLIDQVLANR